MSQRRVWWPVLVFALVGGGAAFARAQAAPPAGACLSDVQRLCSDAQPGHGGIARCLKAHASELSPACQAERQARVEKMKAKAAELKAACGDDLQKFCADVAPGRGRELACLYSHGPQLSEQCRDEGQKLRSERQGKRELRREVKRACADDAKRLCGDVQPGGGRIAQCLQARANDLSPACREAGEKLRAE